MSLLKQIDDKNCVLEWSPVAAQPNMVVLGNKDSAGGGFEDYGGELELHLLDFSDKESPSSILLGKAKTESRFASIAWSKMSMQTAEYPYGLIAGGTSDGYIHAWDPAKIATGDPSAMVASILQHNGSVNGLQFNPHLDSSHLLASGGSDGEVFVTSLERPEEPNIFVPAPPPSNAKHSAEITKVAWNTQVAHILASASQNGSTIIWDLRQKRAWCELREPAGGAISDIAWNPDQGLHFITASGDDKNPVLKLWDLRSSASLPLATLSGHNEGILSISWCPNDPSLLLSSGKDNKTMLWDLFHLQPVYDLPSDNASGGGMDNSNVFGGLATVGGQQRRYNVSWSSCLPGVVSTSSFDRRVQFYSLTGARSRLGRAPKWLRKPVGATFGFGGKLATFDNRAIEGQSKKTASGLSTKVKISQVVENIELIEACDSFHNAIASGDFRSYCEIKSLQATTYHDKSVWKLIQVICFERNAREELLNYLGFDANTISASVQQFISSSSDVAENDSKSLLDGTSALSLNSSASIISAEDAFGSDAPVLNHSAPPTHDLTLGSSHNSLSVSKVTIPEEVSPQVKKISEEMILTAVSGEKVEPMIRKALVVGNFAAAVDCCLEAGLMAEALLLAQCGEPSLWNKTQAAFFAKRGQRYLFLDVLQAVMKSELMELVLRSHLERWRETLAILCTYAKSEEFPRLCEALAHRLETEALDCNSATLCYMCAANVKKTVTFWVNELKDANLSLGYVDTRALQQFVEKVVVFSQSNPNEDLGDDCASFFAEYAGLLASQGRLDIAPRYLKTEKLSESILRDRLYHAGVKPAGSRPPNFPFTRIKINELAQLSPAAAQQAQQTKAGANSIAATTQGAQNTQRAVTNVAGNQAIVGSAALPVQDTQIQGNGLPAGWAQYTDPTSGRPYFVNQSTGQSQWEPPPVPGPSSVSMPSTAQPNMHQAQFQPQAHQQNMSQFQSPVQPQIQSQFQPQVQQQSQGHPQAALTQSAPNLGGSTFNTAQNALSNTTIPNAMYNPTVQTPFNPSAAAASSPMVASTAASQPTALGSQSSGPVGTGMASEAVQALGAIIASVTASCNPAEKRQMAMVSQAYTILCEKDAAGQVEGSVQEKITHMVAAIQARNGPTASAIQTDLANTVWNQHKDWIKGMKILIPLATKK